MIKVGITEADSDLAGEIIRILINHTDVEITAACSPDNCGMPVQLRHHGLIGETDIMFTDRLSLSELDVLIICGETDFSNSLLQQREKFPELRIIDLGHFRESSNMSDFAVGISEINRKELVRGAKKTYILPPVTTALLIGLYPLAFNLMLNSDIKVNVELPKDGLASFDAIKEERIVIRYLKKIQNSFDSKVSFKANAGESRRGMRLSMTLPSPSNIQDIFSLYEKIYDDHNFTYITERKLAMKEVVGTHKCLITLIKEDMNSLLVEILADFRMRGAAGEAVHILNLLFGLYEKTALALKASSV